LNFPLLLFFVLFAPVVTLLARHRSRAMPHSQGENRDKNPEKTAAAEKSKQTLKAYVYP
jgi:hypothetical protein